MGALTCGAEQLIFSALPDDAFELTVAFYNVGLQLLQVNSRKWRATEDKLAKDIIKAATMYELNWPLPYDRCSSERKTYI